MARINTIYYEAVCAGCALGGLYGKIYKKNILNTIYSTSAQLTLLIGCQQGYWRGQPTQLHIVYL